ncbi:MAG: hypothetical protein AAFX99_22825, partial [Myxococcota bacterium]
MIDLNSKHLHVCFIVYIATAGLLIGTAGVVCAHEDTSADEARAKAAVLAREARLAHGYATNSDMRADKRLSLTAGAGLSMAYGTA